MLNGLLVRKLIEKIEDGSATSGDLSTAQHLLKSVEPDTAPMTYQRPYHGDEDLPDDWEWPVDVHAPDYKDGSKRSLPATPTEPRWDNSNFPISMEDS